MRLTTAIPTAALTIALVAAGCSDKKTTGDPDTTEDVVEDTLDDLDALEEPDTEPDVAEEPDAVDVVEEEPGIGPCGHQPDLPVCSTTEPAPTGTDEIRQFVVDNSIPLRCLDGETEVWEFDVYLDEMDVENVFMMGEIHGSVEIGEASADLLEVMTAEGLVDTLAIEIAMDATDAMNEYVTTGAGPLVDYYGLTSWPAHLMWRVLPQRARQMSLDGTTLRMVGVDTPWRLAWVNEQIEAIAATLSPTSAALLTDTLPAPMEYGVWLEEPYVTECETYRDHVLDNLATICTELTADECERLEFMARGLWLGAFPNSMLMYTAPWPVVEDWFARREQLIYYNYRMAIVTGDEKVYAHMGAAHTAKAPGNVAYMLQNDHTPTAGLVYTVTPAYGPGSRIMYGGWVQSVDPEPLVVSAMLAGALVDNYFLATNHPGVGCIGNPMSDDPVSSVSSTYGQAYDSMFWYRVLTADTTGFMPDGTDPMRELIMQKYWTMQYADSIGSSPGR
jgi:hypothetical protein